MSGSTNSSVYSVADKVLLGRHAAGKHRKSAEPAFEWLHRWNPGASNEEIRGLLGQMLFARDDGNKGANVLSGGEAARLLFCKGMLQTPNVLVLEEPTNNLDPGVDQCSEYRATKVILARRCWSQTTTT